eukprot:33956_1
MSASYVIDPIWIYMSSTCGILGTFIITVLGIHVLYHEIRNAIGTNTSRILSIVYYSSSIMVCVAYGFFRTNVIFPIGISVDCCFGYFLTSASIFTCKLSLYTIFLYRIHMIFGSSPLKYPPKLLIGCWLSYFILETVVASLHGVMAWDLVHLETANARVDLGICTTLSGDLMSEQEQINQMIKQTCMGILAAGDIIYSMFVCGLFINKLLEVTKMTNEASENHGMLLVCRRKTILVLIACSTSLLTMGMSAIISKFGYLISIDTITNAVCVWLMYAFNKRVWGVCGRCVYCSCFCCVPKPDTSLKLKNVHSTSVKRVNQTVTTV